ncbi:HDOD domain-containing protein [Propionivibrio sp.]|uniref:HDOD domain-containing protein n=1 Tax=Propionivibrio sp. TaxID=2212460 RepID=UPI0026059C62|nr:HDOD domain-containing protein [Propionivibrio sp.]
MTPPSLAELASHAEALPSLPEVVNYLMRSLKDERADVDTLAHHINSDPAIVARLLAAANSVTTGLSTRIYSAKQAFLVLGADRVVSIIMASALSYRYDTRSSGFDARLLWRHSLGVASCAQVLAEQSSINPDLAFTGGLLHDIGQLLMFTASPINYLQALDLRHQDDLPLIAAEHSLFGYDHAEAGRALAIKWNMPTEIVDAITAHHEPDESGSEIGNLIHVSEVLSHALDLGEQPNNRVPDLSELACATLGLSWPKLAGHFAEIEARYDGLRIALGI